MSDAVMTITVLKVSIEKRSVKCMVPATVNNYKYVVSSNNPIRNVAGISRMLNDNKTMLVQGL